MELKCLDNLVGITRKPCECFLEELTIPEVNEPPVPADDTWFTKSTSDYFLDELIGIVSMWQTEGSVTCDETLADYYKKALRIAYRETLKQTQKAISTRLVKVDRDFSGFLGTKSFTASVDITGQDYAGMKLIMSPIKDGLMVIKEIATMFEQTATFDILIYRRYVQSNYYELVETIEGVDSVANRYKLNVLTTPLELPMYDDTDGELEYYITYEATGLTPKNNLPLCGQCGRVEAKAGYFVKKYGTRGSDVEDLASWSNNSGNAYGLAINVDFKCDAASIICRMFAVSPEWADAYASAVLLMAGIAVHNQVLTSPEVTRANLLGAENAAAQMGVWQDDFDETIKWLAQNVNPEVNDCYQCNNSKLKVSTVLL